jgi:hypothetical protein
MHFFLATLFDFLYFADNFKIVSRNFTEGVSLSSYDMFRFSSKLAAVSSLLLLAACAGGKSGSSAPSGEYVEITNPMQTMAPGAPTTIWVPSSAEKGIPRGAVLVQEGVQMAKEGLAGKDGKLSVVPAAPSVSTGAMAPMAPAAGVVDVATPSPVTATPGVRSTVTSAPVKKLIAVLDQGNSALVAPFCDQVRGLGVGVPVELGGAEGVAAVAAKESERSVFAGQLWKDNTAAVLVVISAPDGIGAGKSLVADIYDGVEKSKLRRVTTQIPTTAGAGKSLLAIPLADLALRVGDVVNLAPWYGRVFAVEGERVYLNAGRESGLQLGQKLKVYRGGKIIAGIGFDPGKEVTSLTIGGFVGTNGSYGVVKDGQSVTISDTVSLN